MELLMLLIATIFLLVAHQCTSLSFKHKIVRSEETGAYYLLVSNGVRRHIPDDTTLKIILADTMNFERGGIAAISEEILSYFALDRSTPSLHMSNPFPDEKMRVFIQHFEIVEYPWFWTDSYKLPGLFNPAFVQWQGGPLVAWRGGPIATTHLKFGWLSEDYSRLEENREYLGLSAAQDHIVKGMVFNHTQEDPRMLVMSDGRLMVCYIGCIDDCPPDTFNTSVIYFYASVNPNTNKIVFGPSILLDYASWEKPDEMHYYHGQRTVKQKNWVPFEYNKTLHFVHTFYPMQVVKVIGHDYNNFGRMELVIKQTEMLPLPWKRAYGWPIRGGTPAILVRGVYLSLFHAVVKKSNYRERHTYVMGAVTFCPHPPFNLLSMSAVPIAKQMLYDGRWAAPDIFYVVFPAGIHLTDDGNYLWVTLGHQDGDGYMIKLEVEGLFNSMHTFGTCAAQM